MRQCLVTKLKAVVSDDSLPVLRTMQQFTLDAIEASGNAAMTSAQKIALNDFFYDIGAIANSALWQKIHVLLLPMICNDNLDKVVVDYTNNVAQAAPDASWGFVNHGIVHIGSSFVTGLVLNKTFTGRTDSLSLVFVGMSGFGTEVGSVSQLLRIYVTGQSSSASKFGMHNTGNNLCADALGAVITTPISGASGYDILGMNVGENATKAIYANSVSGDNIVVDSPASARSQTPFTASGDNIQIYPNKEAAGLILMASPLTTTELTTLVNAAKGLKAAFTSVV